MRITKVEISNFRSHVETEVEINKCHALVGMNGSGKTAVLEAINLATSPRPRSVDEHDFNNLDLDAISIRVSFDRYFINEVPDGFTSQFLPCRSMYCHVKRREAASPGRLLSEPFVVALRCEPIVYESTGYLEDGLIPEGFDFSKLAPSVQCSSKGFRIARRSSPTPMQARADQINLSNKTIGCPNVFYFDRSRERQTKAGYNSLLGRITKELNWRYRKGIDKPVESGEDGGEYAAIVELWNAYYERVLGFVGKDRRKQLVEDVKKSVAALSGVAFDDLELSLLDLEQPFAKAFFARRAGCNQIEASELGSGMSMLFAYCLLQHVAAQSREEAIFLFDEPELHLHPELQKRLAQSIRSADSQIIYTTHSPLFVDLGNWRSITRFGENSQVCPEPQTLDRPLGSKKVADHLDDIAKWRHHERIYFDADAEMLFAQRVLLVEGPADKYGLPRLAALLGKDISTLTVVSCNGKNKICNYALLCLAYEIEAFVIFDLDGQGASSEENKRVIEAIGTLPYRAFSTSLEELLGVSADDQHKAFKVLERVDAIAAGDIPEEITNVVKAVAAWYSKKAGAP